MEEKEMMTEAAETAEGKNEAAENLEEYTVFTVTASDGREIEMAAVDEFEFDRKHYVVGQVIENDEILDEGCYIYRMILSPDDFRVEKITDPKEFEAVAKAYQEMQ